MPTKWISVEERLPDAKVRCIVYYKHKYCDDDGYWAIGVSFYNGKEFDIGLAYKVTHWMPLPEPPKQENTLNLQEQIDRIWKGEETCMDKWLMEQKLLQEWRE